MWNVCCTYNSGFMDLTTGRVVLVVFVMLIAP
jgi:hypothetical protein